MKNMKPFIILGCLIIGMAISQNSSSDINKTYASLDLSFNFTGESDRQISSLALDPDAKYLYGVSQSSSYTDEKSLILFKMNYEFEIQWIKETSEELRGRIELEIDKAGSYLYLKSFVINSTISKIDTQNANILYTIRLYSLFSETGPIAFSDDYQFAYLCAISLSVFEYNLQQNSYSRYFILCAYRNQNDSRSIW